MRGDRPAVVVSSDFANQHSQVIEVVYLTTRPKPATPTHVTVWSADRLSIAICEQIVTVSKSRIRRYVGTVTESEMRAIDKALQESLGVKENGEKKMKEVMVKADHVKIKVEIPADKVHVLMQTALQLASEGSSEKAEGTTNTMFEKPVLGKEQEEPGNLVRSGKGTTTLRQIEEYRKKQSFSGFLLIKCKLCGKLHGFCVKTPITRHECICGGNTELYDLKNAVMECECGGVWTYKTNATAPVIECNCVSCGKQVTMGWNERTGEYETI